jgi:Mg2+ and Co2+ transporter CorA
MNAYFQRLDELQQTIDDLEVRILRERPQWETVGQLVELRRESGLLRRRLSPHRHVDITLAHPSFDVISGSSAAAEFSVIVDCRTPAASEMAIAPKQHPRVRIQETSDELRRVMVRAQM